MNIPEIQKSLSKIAILEDELKLDLQELLEKSGERKLTEAELEKMKYIERLLRHFN